METGSIFTATDAFGHSLNRISGTEASRLPHRDIDAHQTIVTAALAAKSSAETPKKARWDARSETMRREISRLCSCATSLIDALILLLPALQ